MRGMQATACAAVVAISWIGPAGAQSRSEGLPVPTETVAYDMPSPLSPSAANATVSPASVPQAMDRLAHADTNASVTLGALYASGDFGTDSTTTIWNAALGARVRLGDWALSASLPWMRIRSRSTIFTGIDATPVLVALNTSPVKRTADGFGDLTLGASYTIGGEGSPAEVELSGRAKVNTAAQSSGLSSGENDYALGADASFPHGKVTPFASVSYRFLGNTPVYRLRDGPAASAGVSYALSTATFVLVSYHYSRAATRLVEDAHELFAGASTRIPGSPLRLIGFATTGLSNGAPAHAVGVAVSLDFWNRHARD